jgi:hypothetical protein
VRLIEKNSISAAQEEFKFTEKFPVETQQSGKFLLQVFTW